MVTNRRALKDAIKVTESLKEVTNRVSVLITPTIVNKKWLSDLKNAGADMIGVAVDAASPRRPRVAEEGGRLPQDRLPEARRRGQLR